MESVDAGAAARVLAFLNSVPDAGAIADAVGPAADYGLWLRIGQRLIDRREELGGFTDLRQVSDIPDIGPGRFSEILIAVGGMGDESEADLGDPGSLRDALVRLRRDVRILSENLDRLMISISLEADRSAPLLGQPVQLAARVTGGADHRPRPGVPVTFIAPSATIETSHGMLRQTGISATLLTGPSGVARIRVYAATDEPMLAQQQSALIGLLTGFPAEAGSPSAVTDALDQLISEYSWDVNADFRRAVDLLYVRYGRPLIEGVNRLDYLAYWPLVETPVTVTAGDVGQGVGGTQVRGGAVYTIQFRNWLGPWLQRYYTRSTGSEELDQRIRGAAGSENAAGLIMNYTADYVSSRKGLVGGFIGRTEARRTLNAFVAEGLPGAKAENRIGLTAVLQGTDATLRSGGGEAVAGVAGLQVQLSEEIQRAPDADELDSRLGAIESKLDGKASRADVETALGNRVEKATFLAFEETVGSRFDSTVGLDGFKAFEIATNQQLAAKVDEDVFGDYQRTVDSRFAGKVDETAFTTYQVTVDKRFEGKAGQAAFTAYQATIDQRLDGKVDETAFTTYQSAVGKQLNAKVDETAFTVYQAMVDNRFEAKAGQAAFTAYQATVDQRLDGKLDQTEFSNYQTSVSKQMSGKVDNTAFSDYRKTVDTQLRKKQTIDTREIRTNGQIKRIEQPPPRKR